MKSLFPSLVYSAKVKSELCTFIEQTFSPDLHRQETSRPINNGVKTCKNLRLLQYFLNRYGRKFVKLKNFWHTTQNSFFKWTKLLTLKSGLEFFILLLNVPLQIYLLTWQANSAFLGRFFALGSSNSERPHSITK